LLQQSAKKNTGNLILYDGIFFQILEGPEAEIMALIEKIKKDPRHTSFQIVWTSDIKKRTFDLWSMRYIDYEKLGPAEQNFLQQIPQSANGNVPDLEVLKILAEAD